MESNNEEENQGQEINNALYKIEEETRKPMKSYLRFTASAFQMGGVILVFTLLGRWLDGKYNSGGQAWTLILCLVGVFGGMYLLIKEVIKMGKEK